MPKVAIIGKQNVGKSTFFNALIQEKKSITLNTPGVTRDLVSYKSNSWLITDFPGFERIKYVADDLSKRAIQDAILKVNDYHLLLWVVSINGLNPFEYELHKYLRKLNLPLWLIINFVDDKSLDSKADAFYELGISNVYPVSALNYRNINPLRSTLEDHFKTQTTIVTKKPKTNKANKTAIPNDNLVRIAFIGKPNVGKSTLFNCIMGKAEALVSEVPGTTRDSLDAYTAYYKQPIQIVDTAGIRKNRKFSKKYEDLIEDFSVTRTLNHIKKADVVLLLIDAQEGINKQNKKIIEEIINNLKPFILVINKSDLLSQERKKELELDIQDIQKVFFKFPSLFISAQEKHKITHLLELVFMIYKEAQVEISTSQVNNFIQSIKHNPLIKNHRMNVLYASPQKPHKKITLFVNKLDFPQHLKRFFKNKIQDFLKLNHIPLEINFQLRSNKKKPH